MKNLNKFRFVTVILVLLGMTFGMFFPAISVRRATALEKLSAVSETQKPSAEEVNQKLANTPVYFEENRGQQDKRVKYFSRGGGSEMFLTATEAVYVLRSPVSSEEGEKGRKGERETKQVEDFTSPRLLVSPSPLLAVAIYMRLAGANEDANFAPSQQLEHRTNYFKGNERDWRTEIPNYRRITAENIYDGVNMIWQGKEQGGIQYDFVVAPNANPNQIEWEIEGADNVSLDAEGGLVIETEAGVMKQSKPFTFQETEGVKSEVTSGFILSEQPASAGGTKRHRVKFALGEYDRTKPLTIDPTMNFAYSTFLGGETRDEGRAIAVDGVGNVYVTGFTNSTAFPTAAGTFDTTQNGFLDVFVTKLNAAGSSLVYSTFLGGSSDDLGYGIAVDSSGNAFVTGYTGGGAPTYPTTAGAFDTTFNGNFDVFVTKLNAAGSALLYSTFIGGSGFDVGKGIVVDSSGNAFVPGLTDGGTPAYPTTAGVFDTTHNGDYDVFVTKLNAAGSALVYSTFIGGSSADASEGIVVDSSGNAFVTGYTNGGVTAYPTTAGAFDTTHNGAADVFITKLNAGGSSLLYSTFVGGSNDDLAFGIAADSAGNAFVAGRTTDDLVTDYPTTAGAFDTTHNGFLDVFVTKLNAAGSGLLYSTFLGGSNDDFGNGITVDSSGNAFVTGRTDGAGYPTTAGGFDITQNGNDDVFVTKLNVAGSGLLYSTFIGGSNDDVGFGIAVDSSGNAFVTGWTNGGVTDYPTTAGVFDTTHNGAADVFVTKLGGGATPFDFDGDGKTDISIFRPSVGEWWINRSSNGSTFATQFGNSADRIASADFTGDGKTDIAFWRPSTGQWFVLRSEDFSFFAFSFGTSGDVPVPADYDGDGKADAAVFRESSLTWFINKSSGGTDIIGFGAAGDKPVVGDYDGDSKADIAIYRPNGANGAEWWIRRSSNASVFALQFGASTDKPVQADYTGDGKADVAFWRPSNGNWFILRSEDFSFFAFPLGANGDVPVAGDYDGDGKIDAGVFRPSSTTWFVQRSTAGTLIQQFGIAGDVPLPSAFVP